MIRIFARDPDRVPQIQKAFRKFMQSLTRDVVRSLHASPVKLDVGSNGTEGGMTTSPLKATVETDVLAAMDHLHTLGLTGSTIAPRTTTIRGTSVVREYEPHPIDEVPDERAWIQLSAERGWSPMRRPSGRTSGNGTSSSTPLRGRKLDFDDDGDVVSGGAVGPKGNVLDVEDLE